MVKENMTAKKTRYISVRNGGDETYVENISVTGRMQDYLPAAKLRLREIQRVMPLGKWSITIEQQWKEGGVMHFQMLNVVTGKLQESVL
ncbi:MAG: hypothetical protein HZB37_06270 [Planctomycetes bacterium]|nr:hypothetical protein [Candidatus Omnitrophota bacterium]MBI5307927.1 hypothetical protein [Planctomycetota bacterium]